MEGPGHTEVRELLERLRKQGAADSQGSFSLEIERAIRLLPAVQTAEASDYVLRLVASAVASGATRFRVEANGSGYRVTWDGTSLAPCDLETAVLDLFGSDPRVSEVILGLLTARRVFARVELRVGELALSFGKNRLAVMRLESEVEHTTVLLERPSWLSHLRRLKVGSDWELASRRCLFASLNWSLPKGVSVPKGFVKGAAVAFGEVPLVECQVIHHHDCDPQLGGGLFLLGDRRANTLVHHGVSYPLGRDFCTAPGRLIWWKSDLPLDISRTRPTTGAIFGAWRDEVRAELEDGLRAARKASDRKDLFDDVQEWLRWEQPSSPASDFYLLDQVQAHAQMHRSKSEELLGQQKYEEALAEARVSVSLDPSLVWLEAICLGLMGDFEAALPLYERAIEYAPDHAFNYANLAEDLVHCGRHEEALARVEEALRLEPEHSHALGLKARLIGRDDPVEGSKLAKSALALPGCPASVWETLANICLRLGNQQEAREAFQRFLEEARPETLWENDLQRRLSAAREYLSGCDNP